MVGNKNIYKDVKAGIFSLQGGLAGAPPSPPLPYSPSHKFHHGYYAPHKSRQGYSAI